MALVAWRARAYIVDPEPAALPEHTQQTRLMPLPRAQADPETPRGEATRALFKIYGLFTCNRSFGNHARLIFKYNLYARINDYTETHP